VTPTPLIYAIAKVLLHRLGPFFPVENIYSSAKVGTGTSVTRSNCVNLIHSFIPDAGYENVYEKLMQKYGKSCSFVVIGDGMDEESAAKKVSRSYHNQYLQGVLKRMADSERLAADEERW
jgi:hypothetical protein